MKRHLCKCGEKRPSMFYGEETKRCLTCRSAYNVEYYKLKRKKAAQERKQRQQHLVSCPDGEGVCFNTGHCYVRFCQARRGLRGWREGQVISCTDCELQDKVDEGFIPKNILIKPIDLVA